ncbi:SCP-like protein [Ancylostoma duodenale]|uniref:SCP-like protein n=1 Tax=Ancylostoma duodenale TaxID=51022 RepID=A0A0C2E1Q7_9BILA|nr:SCP-like protein [Ancylostoma duodenale]
MHCTGSELSPVIRSLFHRFHNELRRKVAIGEYSLDGLSYGPASNMYELIYDCHMEEIARRSFKFSKIEEFGVSKFSKINKFGVHLSKRDLPEDGMLFKVIEEILYSWSVSGGLRQMIHFYTTRIGCYYSIDPSEWALEVVCLYDNNKDDIRS